MRGGTCRRGPIYPEEPYRRRRALSASSVAEGPPGFRQDLSVPQPRRASRRQISNRKPIRLETHLTHRKQRTRPDSNRKESTIFQFDIRLRANPRFSNPRLTQLCRGGQRPDSTQPNFVSVRKKSALCFLPLAAISNRTLFRLEITKFTRPEPFHLGGLADRNEVSYITRPGDHSWLTITPRTLQLRRSL